MVKKADFQEIVKKAKEDGWFFFLGEFLLLLILVFGIRSLVFAPFTIPSGSMVPTLLVGDYISVTKYDYGYSKYSFPFSLPLFKGRVWETLPKRGDVVVFRFTQDPSEDYIKRVVGLPGDHIKLSHGTVYLNNNPLQRISKGIHTYPNRAGRDWTGDLFEEKTVPQNQNLNEKQAAQRSYIVLQQTEEGIASNTPEYIVPENCLFVMGDNRDDSSDSRFHGGRQAGACAAPLGNDYPRLSQTDLGFVPVENLEGKARRVLFSFDFTHPKWAFWFWPWELRYGRFFRPIEQQKGMIQ